MKSHLEILSPIRKKSRDTVRQVIADHVFGDVTTLPREDLLELRRVLLAAYPFEQKSGWEYASAMAPPPQRLPSTKDVPGG